MSGEESQGARTGGRMVVEALAAQGVDTVFCVPGESYLPILDALYDVRNSIRLVVCRHEHGAADMAEAYGKLTGRPGVCLVTRGPGACNASIAVHTAFQDSTPMLLLVGQVPVGHMGREAFQEVDFRAMFQPLAKRAVQVPRTADVAFAMADAFETAVSGRPGPVVLALPEDVLSGTADVGPVTPRAPEPRAPEADLVGRLQGVLAKAERPLMLVGGGGWTEAGRADIAAFAAAAGIPTCCSFRRHDLIDNESPVFVGEMGIGADPALVARARAADVLLVVGARLGEMTSQGYTLIEPGAPAPALVHVHVDPEELGRVFRPALGIAADVNAAAAALRAMAPLDAGRWRDWAADARADYRASRTPAATDARLDLGRAMAALRERLPADAIVTVDAGNFSGWPQRFLSFGGGRRLLGATNGAMGYGVPAAVAAKAAAPERVVVACVGDGGFGMTGQELATAAAQDLAPIVLVFDNGMYGTIRMHQERRYPDRVIGTGLTSPDFAALAAAYGAHGETVERTDEFMPAFERALASGRAAVLWLRADPEQITTRRTMAEIRGTAVR